MAVIHHHDITTTSHHPYLIEAVPQNINHITLIFFFLLSLPSAYSPIQRTVRHDLMFRYVVVGGESCKFLFLALSL